MPRYTPLFALLPLLSFGCHADRKESARFIDDASVADDGAAASGDGGASGGRDGSAAPSDASATASDGSASAGGDGGGNAGGDAGGPVGSGSVTLPPVNAAFDYQLGGDYTPPAGVKIVSRDRQGEPAAGLYNICYVNGFQSQPGERDFWVNQHADLVLKNTNGTPVIDPDWPDEVILDVSTAEKRSAIFAIEKDWIDGCAQKGFDAVEIDNLDTYTRFGSRLKEADAVAMIRMLADEAHLKGMAIAQKNSAEMVGRKADMGTDFVVAEECDEYDECDVYTGAYGDHVLVIEYKRAAFQKGCSGFPNLSIVLRDLQLVTKGSSGYVFEGC